MNFIHSVIFVVGKIRKSLKPKRNYVFICTGEEQAGCWMQFIYLSGASHKCPLCHQKLTFKASYMAGGRFSIK